MTLFQTPLRRFEIIFLFSWLLLNLLQAAFTALSPDEAYYWMYAQYPDWAYFDHPPMVALFIRAGGYIFSGTLGVRLLSCISQLMALLLLRAMVVRQENEKHLPFFWLLAAAIPVFEVYGFITTPDAPLLFFGTLFFFVYRNFLSSATLKNALLLGLVSACMLYSKYHGVLIIFFTLCSNLRLLRMPLFWLAGLFASLLMLPHLWWHIRHDFPVIYYHFYWRASEFRIDQVTGYLFAQLLVFSPLILPFFIPGWRRQHVNPLTRAMRFCFIGFLLFFFIFSFRERIEAHWTLSVCIPLIYLGFEIYTAASEKFRHRFRMAAIISIVLVTAARSILFFDILPVKNDFHKLVGAMRCLEAEAGNEPVIFSCSYQKASMYSFYSGHHAHSMNGTMYRKNQYDIWDIESSFYQKTVMLVFGFPTHIPGEKRFPLPNGDTVFILHKPAFMPVQKTEFMLPRIEKPWKSGSEQELELVLENHYSFPINLSDPRDPVMLDGYLCKFGKVEREFFADLKTEKPIIEAGEKRTVRIKLHLPDIQGTFNMGLSLHHAQMPLCFNSNLTLVTLH